MMAPHLAASKKHAGLLLCIWIGLCRGGPFRRDTLLHFRPKVETLELPTKIRAIHLVQVIAVQNNG